MDDIEDWDIITQNIKDAGFSDYSIEDYDFFGEGIYGMMINDTKEAEQCTSAFFRAKNVLPNSELFELINEHNGNIKVYIENKKVTFELILPGSAIIGIYNALKGAFMSSVSSVQNVYESFTLPIYQ
jgi:hypothetical protein